MNSTKFGIADYIVFCLMLLMSLSIGVYHALTGGRQRTAGEFLLGDRQMGLVPVCLSLLASFMSAVALLGIPSEIYTFGTQYTFMIFGYVLLIPIVSYLFLPIYYDMGITSIYEYLERRFNKIIRKFAAIVFIFQMCLYLAVVTYAPSLALSHVMGLHMWTSVGIVIGVCTLYSTIGGIKAVMWTDVLQTFFMFVSVFVIMVKGCYDVGGIEKIWRANIENKRIEFFNYSFNPTTRHTVWTQTIGAIFTWLPMYGVNQAQVQRYLSTASLSIAKKALWGNLFGLIWNAIVCNVIGLSIYARYQNCDPVKSKQIEQNDQGESMTGTNRSLRDQKLFARGCSKDFIGLEWVILLLMSLLLPLFALETFSSLPGFVGLFVAGILSGSLSSLSSGLNSLAAVTWEDFMKDSRWKNIFQDKSAVILKGLAFTYGIVCLLCVVLVALYPNISQAALGIFGLGGPILGVFVLGMFCPWTSSLGAGVGVIVGMILIVWLTTGVLMTKPSLSFLPVSVDGCNVSFYEFSNHSVMYGSSITPLNINEELVTTPATSTSTSVLLPFYSISYMWYGLLTTLVVVITGLVASFITGPNKYENIDPLLISPVVRRMRQFFCKRTKSTMVSGIDYFQKDTEPRKKHSLEMKDVHPHKTSNF